MIARARDVVVLFIQLQRMLEQVPSTTTMTKTTTATKTTASDDVLVVGDDQRRHFSQFVDRIVDAAWTWAEERTSTTDGSSRGTVLWRDDGGSGEEEGRPVPPPPRSDGLTSSTESSCDAASAAVDDADFGLSFLDASETVVELYVDQLRRDGLWPDVFDVELMTSRRPEVIGRTRDTVDDVE